MMQKKTALRTTPSPKVSPHRKGGLIAKAKTPKRSARTESVLDNLSHRTPSASASVRQRAGNEGFLNAAESKSVIPDDRAKLAPDILVFDSNMKRQCPIPDFA